MLKKKNLNWGKSRCCKAEIDYCGGGYDGEEISPVEMYCKKCGKQNPYVIQKVGRPTKKPF